MMALSESRSVIEGLKNTPKGKLCYNSASYSSIQSPRSLTDDNHQSLVVPLPLSSPPKTAANAIRMSPLVAVENNKNTRVQDESFESRRKSDSSVVMVKPAKSKQQGLQASNSEIAGLIVYHEMQAKKNIKAEGKQRKNEFVIAMQKIKLQSETVFEKINSRNNEKYHHEVKSIENQQDRTSTEDVSINDLKNKHNHRAQLASKNQKSIQILKKEIVARKTALEETRKQNLELSKKLETMALTARELLKNIENMIKSNFDTSTLSDIARDIHGKALSGYREVIDVAKSAITKQQGLVEACSFGGNTIDTLEMLKKKLSEEIGRIENSKKEEDERKMAEQKAINEKRKMEEEKLKAQAEAQSAGNNKVVSNTGLQSATISNQDNLMKNCVSSSALAVYEEIMRFQREVALSYADLVDTKTGDPNMLAAMKTYRFNLSKVINTPINAISDQSPAHLVDKIERLTKLLNGNAVELGNKTISAKDHPSGMAYCKDVVAKKLVLQGARQISSSFNSAFSIAAVTLGIWAQLPEMGKLILAHCYIACPYLVPYYIPKKQEQSLEEYLKVLGYEVDGNTIESEEKYLKKLSGIVRLYAAIVQSPMPPHLASVPHPHGIHNAWSWLVRLLNLEPIKTITATIMFDFLEVAGHALFKTYGKQFQKLLRFVWEEFLPKIDAVTPADEKGPIGRLRNFLEKCIQNGNIPVPEGYLSARWWKQKSFQ